MNLRILFAALFTFSMAVSAADESHAQIHSQHGGKADYPALNYDSLWAGAVPLADSKEGQELLAACLEAFGGKEHLQKLSGFKAVWSMQSKMTGDSTVVTRSVAAARQHKIHVAKTPNPETRILNGAHAWHQSGDQVMALDGMRYKAELFSDYTLHLPLSMQDDSFAESRYLVRQDDSLKCIILDLPDSLWFVVGIDPADHLIRRVEGVIRHQESRTVFVNLFDDYKEFSGYLFPQAMTNISIGLKVGESRLVSLSVNPAFGAEEFTSPGPVDSTH